MWLVLCESTDASALWARDGLMRRGPEAVESVTAEALAYARWVHTVGANGGPNGGRVEIGLPDGREVRSDQVRGTLNRLVGFPQDSLMLIQPSDREYVHQELTAFFLGWLSALPGRILNPPSPQCLCGHVRHISEWIWLAGRAGLPVPDYRQGSSGTAPPFSLHPRLPEAPEDLKTFLVVGGQVVGDSAPAPILEGCRRLGALSRTPLIGVDFSVGPDDAWQFAGATTVPDLTSGGDALIDALASTLVEGEGDAP